MNCDVYANNNEIACKAGGGKVIAAFPDVCLSPPSPPAGPIPIPYPDTSFSKDMMNGSKTVKIKNHEVMLKNQSFYKTAPLGDEAATQGLGANVITHVITGKTYFQMWSMDVKFEGQNVDRHIDITTSNHASMPPGVPVPSPNVAAMLMASIEDKPGKEKCVCCNQARHSAGKPMTQDQWYTTDVHGNPLPDTDPRVIEYKALMKEVKNKKNLNPPCTCNGRVTPKAPCNVFRKPVSDAEYDQIVADGSGPAFKVVKQNLGLPATTTTDVAQVNIKYQILKNRPPTQAELTHEAQLERQGNHLVPKAAGGCPTGNDPNGEGNVALIHGLCGRCRAIDARFTDLQGKTPRK